MNILEVQPENNGKLRVMAEDRRVGLFDVSPYLKDEAFAELNNLDEFKKVSSGGYFIEWSCGADLSADTIEAHWEEQERPC